MDLRGVLVALIVAATAAFVVGVALERGRESGHHGASHSESAEAAEIGETRGSAEARQELRPLGLDVEAWPFVAAAAGASLALAAAASARPRAVALPALVAAAMLVFGALDVREVVHQVDEDAGAWRCSPGRSPHSTSQPRRSRASCVRDRPNRRSVHRRRHH